MSSKPNERILRTRALNTKLTLIKVDLLSDFDGLLCLVGVDCCSLLVDADVETGGKLLGELWDVKIVDWTTGLGAIVELAGVKIVELVVDKLPKFKLSIRS
jgi:hypothetical protein